MANTRWEYLKKYSKHELKRTDLNHLGEKAWELVNIKSKDEGHFYTFKRPIMDSVIPDIMSESDKEQAKYFKELAESATLEWSIERKTKRTAVDYLCEVFAYAEDHIDELKFKEIEDFLESTET